jgi:hypothetical protein
LLSQWVHSLASVHISASSVIVLLSFFSQVNNCISWLPKWSVQTVIRLNNSVKLWSGFGSHDQTPSEPRSGSEYSWAGIEPELLEVGWNKRKLFIALNNDGYYKSDNCKCTQRVVKSKIVILSWDVVPGSSLSEREPCFVSVKRFSVHFIFNDRHGIKIILTFYQLLSIFYLFHHIFDLSIFKKSLYQNLSAQKIDFLSNQSI